MRRNFISAILGKSTQGAEMTQKVIAIRVIIICKRFFFLHFTLISRNISAALRKKFSNLDVNH